MRTYRALTLWQPWASLVASGAKQIETRSWATAYRGPLLIHAAKFFPQSDQCYQRAFFDALNAAGLDLGGYTNYNGKGSVRDLPLGVIVAVCELRAVYRITDQQGHFDRHLPDGHLFASYPVILPPWRDTPERAFGDYTPGRYAWLLSDVRALCLPIPARGAQGLWEWTGEIESEVAA